MAEFWGLIVGGFCAAMGALMAIDLFQSIVNRS